MNTSFYIAKRYLFAKKSTNAINIISAISVVGVFVGTAALVIILSAFNGLEDLIIRMTNVVAPELVIAPVKGKSFDPQASGFSKLKTDSRVFSFTEVLSENALVWYKDKQSPALIKGVSDDYLKNAKLDSITVEGQFVLNNPAGPNAIVGSLLQAFLAINTSDPFERLQIYSPKKGMVPSTLNPMDNFNVQQISVAGVFEVQQDIDQTAIVPLAFARTLFDEPKNVSTIEINLKPGVNVEEFQREVMDLLGQGFAVKNRVQQNQALYHVLGSEKWMVYIILTFIVIIAIFNIIGSLTMLVIEKLKDISILHSLGAGKKLIRRIFLVEGMMITISGCIVGLVVGLVFCLVQQRFGFIKMGEVTIISSNAYPIAIKWKDFILVFFTVCTFSFIASSLAAGLSVKKIDQLNQDL